MKSLRTAAAAIALATGLACVSVHAQTAQAGPEEIDNCTIPQQLVFLSEDVGPSPNYKVQRYVRFPGGELNKMVPKPGFVTAKNPIMVPGAAPYQGSHCSNGSVGKNTQWFSFRIRTINYFSTGIADHIIMGIRAHLSSTQYDAKGPIFIPSMGGIVGERSSNIPPGNTLQSPPPPQIPLNDWVQYRVEIQATPDTVAYNVTDETNGGATGWSAYTHLPPLLSGEGFWFAIFCANPPWGSGGSCENVTTFPFRVDIWDIATGWF